MKNNIKAFVSASNFTRASISTFITLLVGLYSANLYSHSADDLGLGTRPLITVETFTLTAHTVGYAGGSGIPHFLAPAVPNPAEWHSLEHRISCPVGYNPVETWYNVTGSHPALDRMYSIYTELRGDEVYIGLRARRDSNPRVYAYVKVFLLCSRL